MKIVLLHYTSPPVVGGVESVLAHHARLMTRVGHEVMILAGRGEAFDEHIPVRVLPELDSRGYDVMKVKAQLDEGEYTPDFDSLREQIKDNLQVELKDCDILIAHNIASLHKNLALTAAIHDLYMLPGFPRLILWHHDLAWTTRRYRQEMHAGYPWDLLRQNWEGARHVAVSRVRRRELSRLLDIPQEHIHVITNGVDVNTFLKLEAQTIQLVEQLHLSQADPLFLLPARLTPRKNIELALRVLAELRGGVFPKAMLLVTGPEGPHNPNNAHYKQRLLDLRQELNLQGGAYFLAEEVPGYVPDEVIADFYRLADALLFPSQEEGFGLPLIEAAISSLPAFVAKIDVLLELGGEDVNYFDLDADPHAIAEMIAERLQNEATSRWSRRVKHHYTWDAIYESFIDPLLREVKA